MGITKYYNFNALFSHQGTYNFCVGGRGLGKTYGISVSAVNDAVKTGIKNGFDNCDQFIYLRRYKEEIQISKETFFAAISHNWPLWDFRINGDKAEISPKKDAEKKKGRIWKVIGYFYALSVAQKYKSVAYPRVKKIIYDEFIIEKGMTHYLPNEAIAFNNFYSTVDRYKAKTKVFFLANSVVITNPYFIYYKIDPAKADSKGFLKLSLNPDTRIHFIVCHFPESKDFQNEVFQTAFGRFIEGTEYADYAVANKFSDAHDGLLASKNYKARYMFTLETDSGTFSVWYDVMAGQYFCQEKRPRDDESFFTLNEGRMGENKTLMTFADKPLSMLRTAFRHARVAFDTPQTRNAFLEIFTR